MKKYIAYYRVSTKKQGKSGLGLDAQKETVGTFISANKSQKLVMEYQDIESGKNDNRPELHKAIEECKRTGATLLIAKLDRLSRNVQFIFMLRDSKVEFVALDIPDANTLTIGIFAVVAQHERERISQRIKEALKAKKTRGQRLGTPQNLKSKHRIKGLEVRIRNSKEDKNNLKAIGIIKYLRNDGLSFAEIASKLNKQDYKTRRGKEFFPITVQRLYSKI